MSMVMFVISPWVWACYLVLLFCTWRAHVWFVSPHPHWDRKVGKQQSWSLVKYGLRPQDVFYRKWEHRRILWTGRLGKNLPTLEALERQKVRDKYGLVANWWVK